MYYNLKNTLLESWQVKSFLCFLSVKPHVVLTRQYWTETFPTGFLTRKTYVFKIDRLSLDLSVSHEVAERAWQNLLTDHEGCRRDTVNALAVISLTYHLHVCRRALSDHYVFLDFILKDMDISLQKSGLRHILNKLQLMLHSVEQHKKAVLK